MFHDMFGLLSVLVPLLVVAVIFLLPNRLLGGSLNKGLDKNLEETRQRTALWHQETAEFQQQLLTELRRHNAVMEQQSQLLARLLERGE